MLCRLHLLKNCRDDSVSADDEGGPFGSHVGFAVHAFFHPDSVGLDELLIWVAEQGKRQGELMDEFFVAFHGINTDPEDVGFFRELGPGVPDAAGLSCASGGVVFGVKVEYDRFVPECGELDRGSGAVGSADGGDREVRCGIADFGSGHWDSGRKKGVSWQL